jgi:ABC-type nickel/cobalt efflux system permease component RcnA
MRRLPVLLATTAAILLATTGTALAQASGAGLYGETDDKVVTDAGFILIAFFPLFVFVATMFQWRLDKRKENRKKAHKALAGDEQAWRGGW